MKRPVFVTIIGWLFIVAGTVGFVYHFSELNSRSPFSNDAMLVLFVRLLAVVGGILTLRGFNIGRWLLVIWMVYHVVLSFYHSVSELIAHAVFTVVIAYLLFRTDARIFFKRR